MNKLSASEWLKASQDRGLSLSELMCEHEMALTGLSLDTLNARIDHTLEKMFSAIDQGLVNENKSLGGLLGGQAKRFTDALASDFVGYTDDMTLRAVSYALGVMEVNAQMGIIVAAPTAGSCGVLPACLRHAKERFNLSQASLREGLLAAGVIGYIVTKRATVSGAEGGCQAEVGTATAMAAAALVVMRGGTAKQAFDAGAFCFKNIMGLVCDPIAGLVEVPCTKRNALGVMNAILSADMALMGIQSVIPFDEVVDAMASVGRKMSPDLKETARGGIAICPSALKIKASIFGQHQ